MNVLSLLRRTTLVLALAGALLGPQGCSRLAEHGMSPHEPDSSAGTTPSWYFFDWMARAPYAPIFHVRDTESSLGPYADHTKTITIEDLIKMHGHPCDGLVTAAGAMYVGLRQLYPDGVIDRTDTCCTTNNSPCYGDVAAYLTGGRIRFGTQKIDPNLGNQFILHRISTGQTVTVTLKDGVFPKEVASLEAKLRAGDSSVADIRRCQRMEWDYARHLLNRPLDQSFSVVWMKGYAWQADPYIHAGTRGDVIKKNALTEMP